MEILNQLETQPLPIEEEERNHTRRLLVGLLCALIITGLLLGGYLYLAKRHEREVAAAQPIVTPKAAPKLEIFVDEATLEGKQTVLGGTIHNISAEPIKDVAVELELTKRAGGALETMIVAPAESLLASNDSVRYRVSLPASDYASARMFRVFVGENRQEVPFKAM